MSAITCIETVQYSFNLLSTLTVAFKDKITGSRAVRSILPAYKMTFNIRNTSQSISSCIETLNRNMLLLSKAVRLTDSASNRHNRLGKSSPSLRFHNPNNSYLMQPSQNQSLNPFNLRGCFSFSFKIQLEMAGISSPLVGIR